MRKQLKKIMSQTRDTQVATFVLLIINIFSHKRRTYYLFTTKRSTKAEPLYLSLGIISGNAEVLAKCRNAHVLD